MTPYTGIFKNRYPELKGKNWLSQVTEEDKKAFIHIGFIASDCGRKGGRVRASTAKRDNKGRFIKS